MMRSWIFLAVLWMKVSGCSMRQLGQCGPAVFMLVSAGAGSRSPIRSLPTAPSALSFGHAVALVQLDGVQPTRCASECATEWSFFEGGESEFGDYSEGRFAWITSRLQTFDPFPLVGHQGLFDVDLPEGLLFRSKE